MKKTIFTCLALFVLTNLYGQAVKVNSSGKVGIGGEPSASYTLTVSGSAYSSTLGCTNINFGGDAVLTCSNNNGFTIRGYGGYGGYRARVGINTPYRTDASLAIGSNYPGSSFPNTWALHVNGPQFSTSGSNFQTSDSTVKKNFKDADASSLLEKLLLVEVKEYEFKNKKELENLHKSGRVNFGHDTLTVVDVLTGKERKEVKPSLPWYPAGKQLGVMAGQLKQVFPELVRYDSSTYLYAVNYQAFTPILIQALKATDLAVRQTDARVEELENELENLKTRESVKSAGNVDIGDMGTELFQNAPNPFSESTRVKYYVGNEINNAIIYIYDMNGKQIKSIPLTEKGNGSVEIKGNELYAGMFIYTMIADGKEVASKRMILTE